jgi:putative DNA primase/helicase
MDLITGLSPEHYKEIHIESSVSTEVSAQRGYRTLTGTGEDRDLLESLGFKPYIHARETTYPALLIPMYGMGGFVRGHQIKPAVPRMRRKEDGTPVPIKYETPAGAPSVIDVPLPTSDRLRENPTASLWITEGVKKVDCLVSQGMAAIGLTGVFNWRAKDGILGDWEEIPLKGRPVVICFDADAASNRHVQLAMSRLGAWLRSRSVLSVHYLVVPAEVAGTPVKGVDDYFTAGGTMEDLAAAATQVPPGTGEKDASFTDAFLVEQLSETLQGRYCWASGLGWLRWDGRIWKDVSDVEPLESVRQWASEQFDAVLKEQRREPSKPMTGAIAGWRAILGKSRLVALRDLSRGLIQRDAAEFDGDPDLLTCENGTVHLPTGKLLPFDPEHCITKMCAAEYHPEAFAAAWTSALSAIPADMHEWFQDRLGQALTGYMTPDHMMVIAHGGGSNGKSTVMEIVRKTVAGYGVLVSDRVLMASPDAHPTELMDFKGSRYALMEETPEARHLNVQRLKQTVGTPTIKARRIRMDPVEFIASHSLFINTNYRPTVTETDHGTWRRLSLMPWPYTFRKPGQPLESPMDRVGDPALAYAANQPAVRDAALAWMVAGAVAWYARGRMMLPIPERVERETRDWRAETDLVLGFADECLRFDPNGFVQTQSMLKAFNDWAGERGHRPWNDRTFASRFGSHDVIRAAKVQQGRFSIQGRQQRGWSGVEINEDGMDPFSGMRDEPEPPAPEEPREYGGCICGSTSTDKRDHADYCGFDRSEQVQARGETPVALGFDLETADADKLFTGGHEGEFVRLTGAIGEDGGSVISRGTLVDRLDEADVIYGHNILGFDLLALAHHEGADYDALAAKAVDTMVLARLVDPPLSKGMPNGYYGLDQVAHRLGHEGKTDDLKALAKLHGGFDRIPLDSREYQDYLRGDLAATKHVYEGLRMLRMGDEGSSPSNATIAYAEREMKIVALQNRMTLNGWAVDTELLAERVAHEDAQRAEAVRILADEYGMPTHRPDRFKLRKRDEWPESQRNGSVAEARVVMTDQPYLAVEFGLAERIPGERYDAPWATVEGREAIERAFRDAGAKHLPTTKSGALALGSDALGDKPWFNTDTGKSQPGLMQVYAGNEALGRVVELVLQATGARRKYAEVANWVTDKGRVHAWIGAAQGSGRWAHVKPGISTMGKRGAGAAERDIMVADPGQVIITCDLSQVDLRAMAALSQDPAYIEILQPGRDAHMEMADVYFGQRTPEARQKTKAFNHAGNYGQQPKAVSERTGIPLDKCYEIQRAKAEAYPRLAQYIHEVREDAASGRLLDNGFGRLMRPDPARAFTQGPALMGQGAARDIMCESLLRLVRVAEREELNVRPYLRAIVHDEVVLSVPEGEAELWARLLEEAFTWEWRGVPILCEVSKPAFRWSECK